MQFDISKDNSMSIKAFCLQTSAATFKISS